ncbi:hypothetical protein PIB30_073383 [Stylosanthes scabra]|uniref:Uncharacterized protein n=1 Tax=Stylosanthes scabra TaxID=79078 RepID=A0ABU6VQB8_9FABA|nr:hypothetical protein [Stylosanthes scabra]
MKEDGGGEEKDEYGSGEARKRSEENQKAMNNNLKIRETVTTQSTAKIISSFVISQPLDLIKINGSQAFIKLRRIRAHFRPELRPG